MPSTVYAVFKNQPNARYVMAYTCGCGQLAIGFCSAPSGRFTGTCATGHAGAVTAPASGLRI